MDWFERLTGFRELPWDETRARLEVRGERLHSRVNGRSWGIGRLELASVAELRARAGAALRDAAAVAGAADGSVVSPSGSLRLSKVTGDVRAMHADPANRGALFQVASQFNLLEMIGPEVTPEDGVSRHAGDHTQGPACAVAAGAATLYRNYFAPVDGQSGQTAARPIDALAELGAALGNQGERLWRMCNGYALCTEEGLAEIEARLAAASAAEVDALRDLLRIGLHWDVEVTDARNEPRPVVSQAFCSALPMAYTGIPSDRWRAFATLVLEGAYEATLWAGAINAARGASNIVYLTRLGGGAFGNQAEWIDAAMRRALDLVRDLALDVRVVSFGQGQ